jgi:hypothetical protein
MASRFRSLAAAACLSLLSACLSACGDAGPGRVIVIGVDGADPEVLDTFMAEGKLPHFATLRRDGAYGHLRSSKPMLSPILWTTIATGRAPADHGIGHFVAVNPKTGEQLPVTSQMRRVRAIWNILSDAGRRVGVVGWWATWPAETVNGFIVSDHTCRVQSPGYLRLSPTGCLYVFQLPAAVGAGDPVPATAAVPPARGLPVVPSTDCADTDAARATITDREARTCLPICRPVNVECDFIEVSRVNESRSVCSLKPMNYTQLSPRAAALLHRPRLFRLHSDAFEFIIVRTVTTIASSFHTELIALYAFQLCGSPN